MRESVATSPDRLPVRWAVLRRRSVWLPTWRGWLCLLALSFGLALGVGRCLHSFLAVTRPVQADVLVVEGWVPDTVLKAAIAEFHRSPYRVLVTSGGPRPRGHLTSDYPTYAEETGASLRILGFPASKLIEAPGAPTMRNRTFHSAQAVRDKLADLGITPVGLNVITEGAHARRTWTVFCRVFDRPGKVGVISCEPVEYDPARWWASSEGAKHTLIETIGWLHDFLFR